MNTTPIRLEVPDVQCASLVLGRAFHDDPFMAHLLPNPVKRERLSPKGYQRKGYGSALLKPMLDRFDEEKAACCLDTLNGNKVPFYERFGFKVVAESMVPKTNIGIWLMARKV